MKILTIHIKNLNSLKMLTKIALNEAPIANSGLFAITGDTGAGKTTILDAITLALYGRVHRNKDVKEVLSYGTAEAHAQVEFTVKNNRYLASWSISRARKKIDGNIQAPKRELALWNSKDNAYKAIAEKIREVDEQVEKVTGLDYDRFSRSVVLSQGDFAAFLKSGEKERSDLLERITGTEIYSELSKAAFEKHKIEKEKLDRLQFELDQLQVLDSETLKNIKDELKSLSASAKVIKTSVDKIQQDIQWFTDLEKLSLKSQSLVEEESILKTTLNEFQSDALRLQLHDKVKPFQDKIESLKELSESISTDQQQIEQLKFSGEQLQLQQTNKTGFLKTLNNSILTLKNEWSKKSKNIDQTIKLDADIENLSVTFNKEKSALESLQKKQNELATEQEQTTKALAEIKTQKEDSEIWLKQNKHLKSLIEDLPKIDSYYDNLRIALKQNINAEKAIENAQLTISKAAKAKEKIEKNIKQAQDKLDKKLATFKKQLPKDLPQNRGEILQHIAKEISLLQDQQNSLKELQVLNDQYQSLLREYNVFEAQLTNLQQEEDHINIRMMDALNALDNARNTLDFKQQVYDQQRMIANYEQDRSNLKEGDPCPLCQSTSHPFRLHQSKPFVDQAQKELTLAKDQYDLVHKSYISLTNYQKDIQSKIELLAGNEMKETGGEIQRQFLKITDFENKIVQIAPALKTEDFAIARQAIIKSKIKGFDQQVNDLKTTYDKLIQLNQNLQEYEQVIQKESEQLNAIQLELEKAKVEEKLNADQLSENNKNFEKLSKELNEILKPYDKAFDIASAKAVKETLSAQKHQFENYLNQQQTLDKAFELKTQAQNQLNKELESLAKRIKKSSEESSAIESKITASKKLRFELLGDDDPKLLKDEFEEKQNKLNDQLQLLNDQLKNIELDLRSNVTQTQSSKKQIEKNHDKKVKLSSLVQEAITNAGFSSIDEAQEALLSTLEFEQLNKQQEALKKQKLQLEQDIKTNANELEKHQKLQKNQSNKEDLKTEARKLDEDFQKIQQQIGAINEKITQNNERKISAKQLLKNIDLQRKEFNRWAKLNDIIGQADGKKFRVFAQGLTLKKLVSLANRHLQLLNGRYFIHKRSDEDLNLDIIDTYQADNLRSMNTLSGGESFLVSLSLALGLSDLAGRNTSINSLFIDEGFGTLDEATLDLAISTLENLQSSGKTIGVISHVKALKERIATQIIVKKSSSGFSTLEVI